MAANGPVSARVSDFEAELARFPGFVSHTHTVGALTMNPKWDWAGVPGVYCFVRGDRVVYVGRAIGKTIGQRLWDHLRSKDDPAWAEVVSDADTVVEIFEVAADQVSLAAALEVYLIQALEPEFNLRRS